MSFTSVLFNYIFNMAWTKITSAYNSQAQPMRGFTPKITVFIIKSWILIFTSSKFSNISMLG